MGKMKLITRHSHSLLLSFAVLLVGGVFPCSAKDETGRKLTLLERRPCGPDGVKGPLRYLFFQGCAGADFRSACRRHDLGYDTLGADKTEVDLKFLDELLEESKKSKFPCFARYRARLGYFGVSVVGDCAWNSAQEIARRKANGEDVVIDPPTRRPFARWFQSCSSKRSPETLAPSITK
jgi:hypothetical protein